MSKHALLTPPLTPASSITSALVCSDLQSTLSSHSSSQVDSCNNNDDNNPQFIHPDIQADATHFILIGRLSRSVLVDQAFQSVIADVLNIPEHTEFISATHTDRIDSHGEAILAFFDVRHAIAARTILSRPATICRLTAYIDPLFHADALSCRFLTKAETTELIGSSPLLSSFDPELFIVRRGSPDNDSPLPRILETLRGFFQSHGQLRAFQLLRSENNRQLLRVEYLNYRHAALARKDLHRFLGATLHITSKDNVEDEEPQHLANPIMGEFQNDEPTQDYRATPSLPDADTPIPTASADTPSQGSPATIPASVNSELLVEHANNRNHNNAHHNVYSPLSSFPASQYPTPWQRPGHSHPSVPNIAGEQAQSLPPHQHAQYSTSPSAPAQSPNFIPFPFAYSPEFYFHTPVSLSQMPPATQYYAAHPTSSYTHHPSTIVPAPAPPSYLMDHGSSQTASPGLEQQPVPSSFSSTNATTSSPPTVATPTGVPFYSYPYVYTPHTAAVAAAAVQYPAMGYMPMHVDSEYWQNGSSNATTSNAYNYRLSSATTTTLPGPESGFVAGNGVYHSGFGHSTGVGGRMVANGGSASTMLASPPPPPPQGYYLPSMNGIANIPNGHYGHPVQVNGSIGQSGAAGPPLPTPASPPGDLHTRPTTASAGVESRRPPNGASSTPPSTRVKQHPHSNVSADSNATTVVMSNINSNSSSLERNQLNISKIEDGQDTRTTVMIKNIPNKMTHQDLVAYIGKVCPRRIDFLYLRIDFKNGCNVGYAFVNFITVEDLLKFAKTRLGEKWNMFSSEKVLQMSYANYQGKEALIEKFKNSCIMDEREEWRPRIFYSDGQQQGLPQDFPPPTHLRRKERSSINRGALFVPGFNSGHHASSTSPSAPSSHGGRRMLHNTNHKGNASSAATIASEKAAFGDGRYPVAEDDEEEEADDAE